MSSPATPEVFAALRAIARVARATWPHPDRAHPGTKFGIYLTAEQLEALNSPQIGAAEDMLQALANLRLLIDSYYLNPSWSAIEILGQIRAQVLEIERKARGIDANAAKLAINKAGGR